MSNNWWNQALVSWPLTYKWEFVGHIHQRTTLYFLHCSYEYDVILYMQETIHNACKAWKNIITKQIKTWKV